MHVCFHSTLICWLECPKFSNIVFLLENVSHFRTIEKGIQSNFVCISNIAQNRLCHRFPLFGLFILVVETECKKKNECMNKKDTK